ncbi:acyl transferase/acyl hydrolase/lysophospholipase [Leptodontidium sp. 2 PMI_412]|nr:acyl transferase/acyl hydrolase/lysophospholipase [Leptodontidium sp. 2 PMI_412]
MSGTQQRANDEPLRLLALDGGGVKGLTSLLILRRLMGQLKKDPADPSEAIPRPCEVFDLIGGTSTGGLIAIMLGRLGMTVDECIETYKKFGKDVFGKKKAFGIMRTVGGGSMYKTKDLQTAIQTLVEGRLTMEAAQASPTAVKKENPELKDAPLTFNARFVCATRNKTFNYEIIRNYTSGKADQVDYDCTIWEAGSATAAAPMFFSPVTFLKSGAMFSDGGTTINCPLPEVVKEARRLWSVPQFACIVSLGTGWPANTQVKSKLHSFVRETVKVLTDSQKKYEAWLQDNRHDLNIKERCFRFNVEQGMDKLELDEWAETEEMTALTDAYLRQHRQMSEIERCVKLLRTADGDSESIQS